MTNKEHWKFHRMPYSWKKTNPALHSCAICKNRPIDFCNVDDNIRQNPEPAWRYKSNYTEREIMIAMINGTHEDIKEYNKCNTATWSKTSPFYKNECEFFFEVCNLQKNSYN